MVLTISFCLFTLSYEKNTATQAESRIAKHAIIISDDLWNFNSEGATEYLRLAAEADDYVSITVTDQDGELFQKVSTNNINKFEKFLVKTGINPLVTLDSPVKIHTRNIGWIEAVWIPKTYFLEATVFVILLLVQLITTLWSRVLMSKLELEERVEERTEELLEINKDVVQEYMARIEAQQEQEKLRVRLEQSHKMESLGLLAGGVAHDLNNVLSGLVTYPDYLLLALEKDSPLREDVEIIRDSGFRASEIVQDLLSLTRRAVIRKKPLQLDQLVNEYLESPEHTNLLEASPDTEVITQITTPLPAIEGAATALKKLIMNLVSNAAEAQPDGGVITLALSSSEIKEPKQMVQPINPGLYTVLSVSDQGEGITQVDLPRIFEPFYTRKVMGRSGTGLGLTVVWGTVEDHDGAIDVKSEKNRGTTIDIYLPSTTQQAVIEPKEQEPQSLPGNGQSILVVDDVDYQRKIAASVLTRLNYTVESVASGEEAIEIMKEKEFGLLMLDMVLEGGIDGLDTFKEIRKFRPNQKTIVVSGYSESERVKKMNDLGVTIVVQKPYTMDELSEAVAQALVEPETP